ncbi:MAG: DNA-3-methyladenine glycosylase [Trueperaceae bacterium]
MTDAPPFVVEPSRATEDVAKALLGATLVALAPDGVRAAGRIVETEAYLGLDDPACHSFHGRRTPRVASLYLPAGHAYVYRSYGVHWCLNVVTRDEDRPEAVLIRAVRPALGLSAMRSRRGERVADLDLARGPGNLTRAFGIDGAHDGVRLDRGSAWIAAVAAPPTAADVAVGPRIGLGPTNPARDWPLRFWLRDEPAVSRRRREGAAPTGKITRRSTGG